MELTKISPSDMLLFVSVVREGGFTGAARREGITKQSVSERVARLEARLGVRLLERTTRRVRPTDAGAAYFERCASIAARIDEANAEIRDVEAEPLGLLRVSAPVLFGRRFLAAVLADYLRRYPKTKVEVVLSDRRVNLVDEGIHLAIRVGALDDSSLVATRLGDGYVYCVAAPSFLDERKRSSPLDPRAMPCIGTKARETWTVKGLERKVEPVLVVNDLELACDAAIRGIGVARVPSLVCREAVLDGRLRVLFPEASARPQPVHVVYPSRQYLPAKVRLFVEALRALVAPMEPLPLRALRGRRSRP